MKKSAFINLLIGVVGGLLFALGMCMCLLPQWNAFHTGVVCTAIGFAALGLILLFWYPLNKKRVEENVAALKRKRKE